MINAMVSMFEVQYGEFQKMDYTIDFTKPMNERAMTEVGHLINAERIEPRIEYPFELANGWRKKTDGIIGVPHNTAFHKFVDTKGNVVELPEKGIFITEAIAKILKVKEGDRLLIKSSIPGREDVFLNIEGIVQQYFGANAYMDINEMDALLLDRQMITGLSVKSSSDI
jgi:putative ABC transport system permease protein